MGDSKNRTVFSFSDVPAARSKIEFNVLNPHLIVLAGLRLIFNRDGKRMPKARDEVVTTSHSSMHKRQRQLRRSRFRPILMTAMAALLGGVPLMLGTGSGSEIR